MGRVGAIVLSNFLIGLIVCVPSNTFRMRDEYSWKQFDYQFPNETLRQEQLKSEAFIPHSILVKDTAVWKDKLFFALPRGAQAGVPVTLAYINLNDQSGNKSPKFIPYPDWETNQFDRSNGSRFVSVEHIDVDVCDRLWIHDSGWFDYGGYWSPVRSSRLLVYDLKTGKRVYEYVSKRSTVLNTVVSLDPSNIVVDVTKDKCGKAFAYAPQYGHGILVYDFANNDSWIWAPKKIQFDRLGIALSGVNHQGYRTVYFNTPTTSQEFSVSTKVLQSRTINGTQNDEKVTENGSFAFDEKTGVLLYAGEDNKNTILCWNSIKHADSVNTTSIITVGNSTDKNLTILLANLKVDQNGNLRVVILYDPWRLKKDYKGERVVISTVPVKELIKGTVCDSD